MVDLVGQYERIKSSIDRSLQEVLSSGDFIQGTPVKAFETALSAFMQGANVVSCGNGTDALQIAMMTLQFKPGDEIILPVHTYVATAEVIALLGLKPVFVDVDEDLFTINVDHVAQALSSRTVAVVPVHLYGQCADMESLFRVVKNRGIAIIEDAAQALGANYHFGDGRLVSAGTIGKIGTTSFFPTKNLGAYGDGGAMFTRDPELAERLKMVANHGQRVKYQHDVVGVNSRLDTLQAAILLVKLKSLRDFEERRRTVAEFYDEHLKEIAGVKIPVRAPYSSHVFHQYTIKVAIDHRDKLIAYLSARGIPTMIYYPIPLHTQPAYRLPEHGPGAFPVAEKLSRSVISLPIHTEMDEDQLSYICKVIHEYFSKTG
ncbi:MAG TPA: DegT/DnrJ/EryC1/StrS family aminotransferase [Cyclobacteriaceae bacterium]|nr:DegT/DnrJ/EryC1/StrS family aminotransferase [Cyclobacteriaceae bacterium]